MMVPRGALSRWEHGHELPTGHNMIKLRDQLNVPIGTDESIGGIDHPLNTGFQLVLPFDQSANFELRVTRKGQDTIQLEVVVKGVAS